jgi:hypothetical protein
MPTIDAWLHAAIASVERDAHTGARPILQALAAAVTALRAAPWNADAADGSDAATREARPDPKQ